MDTSIVERTLKKMERSQAQKAQIVEYFQKHKPYLLWSVWKEGRIKECCNVLRFRQQVTGETRLVKAQFCKYDKFCLACATRRSIKMIQRFEAGIIEHNLANKNWYHITLTIRHNKNQSLKNVMSKLRTSKEILAQRFRNSKRTTHKTKSFMHNFQGMISSIEVTYGKNWRHPHIHMLVCGDIEVPTEYSKAFGTTSNRQLSKERYKITKDSYSVGIRKIDVNKGNYSRRGIGEVFKYAVKFSKLSIPQLAELIEFQKTIKHRFFATYGIFRGRHIEQKDFHGNKPEDMLCRFSETKQSYSTYYVWK